MAEVSYSPLPSEVSIKFSSKAREFVNVTNLCSC